MIRIIASCVILAGCTAASGEVADQGGHAAMGYARALELKRNTGATDQQIEDEIMRQAKQREEFQHPGSCGEGCQRDLRWWLHGIRRALK